MGTFSTIGTTRQQVKMIGISLMGFFVVMAMATSAIELPDNMYGNSNNLVNYHQSEEGNLAYNLDLSASTYNLDNGDSLKQQLLHKFHKKYPITSRGVLAPPTMASSRPYYSNEIQSDTIRKGVNILGHNVGKRSPLVIPEDPFLVGGTKAVKKAPIALPKKPYKIYKALTGPLFSGVCAFSSISVGAAAPNPGPLAAKKVLVKVCPKLFPIG